jgi:hypothetical protein
METHIGGFKWNSRCACDGVCRRLGTSPYAAQTCRRIVSSGDDGETARLIFVT